MPLTEAQWTALARDLQAALSRVAPEWTDTNTHDPGVTVLELLAYALGDLQYRRPTLDGHARRVAADVAALAASLAAPSPGSDADDCGAGLQRVNFTHGMLLGVDDFLVEQDYARQRLNRRNRLLHGKGIVAGLEVSVVSDDDGGAHVAVTPGLAFDAAGNEIFVDRPQRHALPAQDGVVLVLLAYAELPCRGAPIGTSDPDDAAGDTVAMQPTRIAESFDLGLASVPTADSLAIARLRRVRGRWRVDPRFKALRLRN